MSPTIRISDDNYQLLLNEMKRLASDSIRRGDFSALVKGVSFDQGFKSLLSHRHNATPKKC
ncbi:hypothetical protein HYU13_01775 [Candidatus Woesearchaeota archaeon]|nr:hypothetical protein [Candidatus Woesearchaeota archaeon]